ncbi:MAG: hypothetical protein WCS91_01180 [Bacilli bacterium]
MGKLLKRILIPVGIVVVLVGGAYFLLSSGNTVPATDGTLTINSDEIQKRLIHGMADTKKNGQISLSLTEEDLNKALNGVLAALPSDAKGKIKGAHVDITDSSYDFAVDIEVPMFKTEIVLVTDLVDNINTDDPLQGSYEFDIKEAKVGRLGHLETIAFSILGGFLNNDSISSSFSSSGIHVTPDLSGRKILYTKANLLADLKTMLSSGDSDSSLAVGFLNQTVESNLLKASFHETDSLKVVADLTSMKTNADYCEEGKASTLDIPAFRDKVASLMNAGIFDISKSNAATMMNYLLKGYASLSDSEKTFISPLDLSSVGITNNETYKGARPSESETVKKALGEGFLSVASEIAAHPSQDKINLFRLGEDTISGTLLESNVFGTSSVLYTKEEDNTYTLATISLTNAYTEILSEKMAVNLELSVNGYPVTLVLVMKANDLDNLKVTFQVQDIYGGSILAKEELKSSVFELLASSLDGSNGMSFDKDKGELSIDMTSYYSAIPGLSTVAKADHFHLSSNGDKLVDDGYLQVYYSLS